MRNRLLLIASMIFMVSVHQLDAQTLSKAEESFAQFNKLRASGATENAIYDALYVCYADFVSVLENAPAASADYAAAKRALREILPFLQMGAAWNSNHGQPDKALRFAQTFMDVPLMPAFQNDTFVPDANYPTMAYFAASGTFNAKEYKKAIPYFQAYLNSGDKRNRENVFVFMAKTCILAKEDEMAIKVLMEGTAAYPSNYEMLKTAINCCIDMQDNNRLQLFVERAMVLRPNDPQLMAIQGKLYEENQDYQKALQTYNKLNQLRPNNLDVYKHLAINNYNMAVTYYNKTLMEQDETAAKRANRQAKEYFMAAAAVLENVINNDPTAMVYAEALAIAYSCAGDEEKLKQINSRLEMFGIQTVSDQTVPTLITYEGNKPTPAAVTPTATTLLVQENGNPPFSPFAKDYIESRIRKWQQKDEFENIEEYQRRVTVDTRNEKVKQLQKEAEQEYIKMYAKNIRFNDLVLKSYDAEHESYLVESPRFGDLVVTVPRANNEAQVFKSSWSGMKFSNPQYCVRNDQLMLSGLTFVTPMGNSYRYDIKQDLAYAETVVNLDFDPIEIVNEGPARQTAERKQEQIYVGQRKSDVDSSIPESSIANSRTFAVIIANEHYDMVTPVALASNDGSVFKEYCEKTLGLPAENIRYYEDASYGIMLRAMRDIKDIALSHSGNLNVIFYYAGHGIPNEETKDAYLLPVDADGKQVEGCYSLNRLYQELGELNALQVVVFLDACFSGAKRDGGMLTAARGIALKAKTAEARGNMVIFSAASDDETALPWEEKGHGLFTYFLLKKLQESQGNVTLKELGDYITTNVRQKSVVVNRKPQTPSVRPSSSLTFTWEGMNLIPLTNK